MTDTPPLGPLPASFEKAMSAFAVACAYGPHSDRLASAEALLAAVGAYALQERTAVQQWRLIGWLCRTKQQVKDAEKAFPGELPDYLWKYTHGTKDLAHFESYDDLEIVRVYAAPQRAEPGEDAT